jgi:hypothetical protein
MFRIFAYLKTWDCLYQGTCTNRTLDGNGVTIVSNAHAVMAMGSQKRIGRQRGISGEEP